MASYDLWCEIIMGNLNYKEFLHIMLTASLSYMCDIYKQQQISNNNVFY